MEISSYCIWRDKVTLMENENGKIHLGCCRFTNDLRMFFFYCSLIDSTVLFMWAFEEAPKTTLCRLRLLM